MSPVGTPFDQRGLPADGVTDPYSAFEVVEPLEVNAGVVAPFGAGGGGIQYELPRSILSLLRSGAIRRIQ